MKSTMLWIGTSSNDPGKGIYALPCTGAPGDGEPALCQTVTNPSYIILSHDGRKLFSVSETMDNAAVVSYAVGSNNALTEISRQPVLGKGPCHVACDRAAGVLLSANYGDGTVSVLPLREDGVIQPLSALVCHPAGGRFGPHAHCAVFSPDEKRIWVCDLGLDKLLCYRWEPFSRTIMLDHSLTLQLEEGKGPRHMLFHPANGCAYLLDELGSRVNTFLWDPDTGALTLRQTLSLLPEDFTAHNGSAAVRCSGDGRFLYCSNRGHNSIAVYAIGEGGLLTLLQRAHCGGDFPRDMDFEPGGNYLYVANQRSDTVDVLPVDKATGLLGDAVAHYTVPSPTCILFSKN